MSRVSRLKYLHLAYFSKPKAQRAIYRSIRRAKKSRIVEIGVGDAVRARRLIQVALRFAPGEVQYTGIDLFEASPKPGLPLISVHRELVPLGAKIRLVPGIPADALAGVANSLANTDLVVISANTPDDALNQAWFYLPRMLHSGSLVLRERINSDGELSYTAHSPQEVQSAAEQFAVRRAA